MKIKIGLMLCALLSLKAVAQNNSEYIALASVKLNGTTGFSSKFAALQKALGKVDSVDDKALECGSFFDNEEKPSYYNYIKGVMIEKSGDKGFVMEIDFSKSPDVFLLYNGGRMDKHTTLAQIRQRFPVIAKKSVNSEKTNDDEVSFWIPPSKEASDDHWILTFREGRLIALRYLIQC